MKVLVIVACLAAAVAAQLQHTEYSAGPISHYEKVVETSAQPELSLAYQQQPGSLLVKSLEHQVPVTGFQQTAYISGQRPASYFKTIEKIENPALLNGQIYKFEKTEGVQKVELPAVSAYTGGYEHSAYIQKQPALASLSGYKPVAAQPSAAYAKDTVAPAVATYSYVQQPAAYKLESTLIAAKPALTSYKKEYVTPAVSTFPAFPAAYKQESTIYSAAPAVASLSAIPSASAYKKETYSAFPAASAYKKEVYSAAPAVEAYSAFPATSAYKQESLIPAKPALVSYKKEFVAPAVSSYSAAPAVASYSAFPAASAYKKEVYSAFPAAPAYKQESLISAKPTLVSYKKEFVAAPAVSSYSAFPATSAYKKEVYSAFPAAPAYKQESLISAKPTLVAYKKEFVAPAVSSYSAAPAVASYSAFPAVSAYKKEVYSAAPISYKQESLISAKPAYKTEYVTPAVSTYSAFPASTAYKQESLIAIKPEVSIYKKEFAAPAVASYSAYPAAAAYKKEVYSAAPAVASYSSVFPAASAYKKEIISAAPVSTYKQESLISAKPTYKTEFLAPAVASYSAVPAASAYKKEIFSAAPSVASYSAAVQRDSSLLYSQQAAKYGGSAMFAGQSADGAASILKLYNDDVGTGVYHYGYATSNGISRDEEGKVLASLASGSKSAEASAEGSAAVTGSYSYTGPDGVLYTVKYIADEQGFRAYGDHLPKLSEEAQRAIDDSAKHAEQKDF